MTLNRNSRSYYILFSKRDSHIPSTLDHLMIDWHKFSFASHFIQWIMSDLTAFHSDRLSVIVLCNQMSGVYAKLCGKYAIIGRWSSTPLIVSRDYDARFQSCTGLNLICQIVRDRGEISLLENCGALFTLFGGKSFIVRTFCNGNDCKTAAVLDSAFDRGFQAAEQYPHRRQFQHTRLTIPLYSPSAQ